MHRPNRTKKKSIFALISTYRVLILICFLAALVLLGAACSLSSITNPGSTKDMTLDQALAVTPRDDRPQILIRMGRPDAFRVTFELLNSTMVRYEEWSYFDDQTRLDFMDGTLVDTVQLDPVADGTIFASYYDPLSFQASMTTEQVKSLLSSTAFTEMDTSDVGQPDGLVLAGQQILLGFDQGQLIYVETFVLSPEVNQ